MDATTLAAVAALALGQTKVAFLGDQGLGADSEAVLELCLIEGADAVVVLGDFDYADDPGAWAAQFDAVLPPCFPVFAVVGNHDDGSSVWPDYQDVIEQRLACLGGAVELLHTAATGAGDQYSFFWQGIFFVFSSPGLLGGGDAAYVNFALNRPEVSQAAWRVSGWHVLMEEMQVGGKSDESGWDVYENSRLRGAIIATAHEHSYERTNLLADMSDQLVVGTELTISEGETFAFVSGMGGESVRDQERCFPTSPPYGCNGTWASVYCSQQGGQHGALFLSFGPGCTGSGYFKDIDGVVIDQFLMTSTVGPCAGETCPWDLDNNGTVNTVDFLELLKHWGEFDTADFLALLQAWGPCP